MLNALGYVTLIQKIVQCIGWVKHIRKCQMNSGIWTLFGTGPQHVYFKDLLRERRHLIGLLNPKKDVFIIYRFPKYSFQAMFQLLVF